MELTRLRNEAAHCWACARSGRTEMLLSLRLLRRKPSLCRQWRTALRKERRAGQIGALILLDSAVGGLSAADTGTRSVQGARRQPVLGCGRAKQYSTARPRSAIHGTHSANRLRSAEDRYTHGASPQTALRPHPPTSPHAASALTRAAARLRPAPCVIAGCAQEP